MTSDAHAVGIYYYHGWSAFTVLFSDAYIAPLEVVHIGDMNEDVNLTFIIYLLRKMPGKVYNKKA